MDDSDHLDSTVPVYNSTVELIDIGAPLQEPSDIKHLRSSRPLRNERHDSSPIHSSENSSEVRRRFSKIAAKHDPHYITIGLCPGFVNQSLETLNKDGKTLMRTGQIHSVPDQALKIKGGRLNSFSYCPPEHPLYEAERTGMEGFPRYVSKQDIPALPVNRTLPNGNSTGNVVAFGEKSAEIIPEDSVEEGSSIAYTPPPTSPMCRSTSLTPSTTKQKSITSHHRPVPLNAGKSLTVPNAPTALPAKLISSTASPSFTPPPLPSNFSTPAVVTPSLTTSRLLQLPGNIPVYGLPPHGSHTIAHLQTSSSVSNSNLLLMGASPSSPTPPPLPSSINNPNTFNTLAGHHNRRFSNNFSIYSSQQLPSHLPSSPHAELLLNGGLPAHANYISPVLSEQPCSSINADSASLQYRFNPSKRLASPSPSSSRSSSSASSSSSRSSSSSSRSVRKCCKTCTCRLSSSHANGLSTGDASSSGNAPNALNSSNSKNNLVFLSSSDKIIPLPYRTHHRKQHRVGDLILPKHDYNQHTQMDVSASKLISSNNLNSVIPLGLSSNNSNMSNPKNPPQNFHWRQSSGSSSSASDLCPSVNNLRSSGPLSSPPPLPHSRNKDSKQQAANVKHSSHEHNYTNEKNQQMYHGNNTNPSAGKVDSQTCNTLAQVSQGVGPGGGRLYLPSPSNSSASSLDKYIDNNLSLVSPPIIAVPVTQSKKNQQDTNEKPRAAADKAQTSKQSTRELIGKASNENADHTGKGGFFSATKRALQSLFTSKDKENKAKVEPNKRTGPPAVTGSAAPLQQNNTQNDSKNKNRELDDAAQIKLIREISNSQKAAEQLHQSHTLRVSSPPPRCTHSHFPSCPHYDPLNPRLPSSAHHREKNHLRYKRTHRPPPIRQNAPLPPPVIATSIEALMQMQKEFEAAQKAKAERENNLTEEEKEIQRKAAEERERIFMMQMKLPERNSKVLLALSERSCRSHNEEDRYTMRSDSVSSLSSTSRKSVYSNM